MDSGSAQRDPGTRTDDPKYSWVRDRREPVEETDDGYEAVLDAARAASVTDRSVDPGDYGEFMCTIFDRWVRNDVGEVSVRLFEQCLQVAVRGEASYCILSETCGDQVAMEHNGDVYACDHYVEPEFRRGNVHETHLAEMLEGEDQRAFGEYKREGLPERCRACPVREFCHGGCPKNRHLRTPGGEPGLNYLCGGYRRLFTHVQPYMDIFERTIREGKPPAFVMDEVAVLDDRGATA